MVLGRGEYARLIKIQERLPVNKPEVVSTLSNIETNSWKVTFKCNMLYKQSPTRVGQVCKLLVFYD